MCHNKGYKAIYVFLILYMVSCTKTGLVEHTVFDPSVQQLQIMAVVDSVYSEKLVALDSSLYGDVKGNMFFLVDELGNDVIIDLLPTVIYGDFVKDSNGDAVKRRYSAPVSVKSFSREVENGIPIENEISFNSRVYRELAKYDSVKEIGFMSKVYEGVGYVAHKSYECYMNKEAYVFLYMGDVK